MKRFALVIALVVFGALLASTGCRDVPVDPATIGPTPEDTVVRVDHRMDTTYTDDEMVIIDSTFREISVRGIVERRDTTVRTDTVARPLPERNLVLFLPNHRGEQDSVVIDARSFMDVSITSMASRRHPGVIQLELAMPVGRYIRPERFPMSGLTLVHLHLINMTTKLGDTTALIEDPEERTGAAITFERKRLATGDVVAGRRSAGFATLSSIDTNRRIMRIRMHADFLRVWPEKPVPIDLVVHLGY